MVLENTVLVEPSAHPRQDAYATTFKPKLIEFHGSEGEDFRPFVDMLNNYFRLTKITNDERKVDILTNQLAKTAKTYFEYVLGSEEYGSEITYDGAIDILRDYFVTPGLINKYINEFHELKQRVDEHPKVFLARLREHAKLAEFENAETQVRTRFMLGLLPQIKEVCVVNAVKTFQDYADKAEGWWSAKMLRTPETDNHSFNVRDSGSPYRSTSLEKDRNGLSFPKTRKELNVADVNAFIGHANDQYRQQPNIAQMIEQLQALELYQLEHGRDGVPTQLKPLPEVDSDMRIMFRQFLQEELKHMRIPEYTNNGGNYKNNSSRNRNNNNYNGYNNYNGNNSYNNNYNNGYNNYNGNNNQGYNNHQGNNGSYGNNNQPGYYPNNDSYNQNGPRNSNNNGNYNGNRNNNNNNYKNNGNYDHHNNYSGPSNQPNQNNGSNNKNNGDNQQSKN